MLDNIFVFAATLVIPGGGLVAGSVTLVDVISEIESKFDNDQGWRNAGHLIFHWIPLDSAGN